MLQSDLAYMSLLLPEHYVVKESKKQGSIHCKSKIGLRQGDHDGDHEHWYYVRRAVKAHFGDRLKELHLNTSTCYVDFTVYLKESVKQPQ